MTIKKMKEYKVFLIVLGLYVCTLLVSIVITLLSVNMMANLVLLILHFLIFCCYFNQKYKEYVVYRNMEGVLIKEPLPNMSTIAVSIAIVILAIYSSNVIQLNDKTFTWVMLSYLVGSYCLFYDNDPLIIFADKAMYFKQRWIPYTEITRFDTDKTNKRRIIVYVFAKKCYSQPLSKDVYEQFEKVRQSYVFHS